MTTSHAAVASFVVILFACGGGDSGVDLRSLDHRAADRGGQTDLAPEGPVDASIDAPPFDNAIRGIFAPPEHGPIPFEALPFPSDARLGANGTIELRALPGAAAGSLGEPNALAALGRLKGFGITTGTFLPFDGAIDPSSLPDASDRGLGPTSSAMLIDLDATPPVRLPVRTATRDVGGSHLVVVIPEPGRVLAPSRRHAVLVTTDARSLEGRPLVAAEGLIRALSPAPLDGDPLARVQQSLTPLAALLPTLGTTLGLSAGLSAERLASATVFTTHNPTAELFELREQLLTSPPPTATIADRPDQTGTPAIYNGTALRDYFGYKPSVHHIKHLVVGSFPSPYFLASDGISPGIIERGPDGRFAARATAQVPFLLFLPDCPGQSGCRYDALPVTILQEVNRCTSVGQAPNLARIGVASIALDMPLAGNRAMGGDSQSCFSAAFGPDGINELPPLAFERSLYALSEPPEVRYSPRAVGDAVRQGALDQLQLIRLLQTPSAIDPLRPFATDLTSLRFAASPLAMITDGYIVGSGLLPAVVEPSIKALVLQAGGGHFTQLIPNSFELSTVTDPLREVFGLPPDDLIAGASSAGLRPEFHPLQHLLQQAFEHGELLAYAPLAARRTDLHILQVAARRDETVPDLAGESLGRALELPFAVDSHTRFGPEHTDLPMTPLPPEGVAGNLTSRTRLYHQYHPAVHALLSSRSGFRHFAEDVTFPPFDMQLAPDERILNPLVPVSAEVARFISSFHAGTAPMVIDGYLASDERIGVAGNEPHYTPGAHLSQEVPLGNLITDLMRTRYSTQIAIIDSGAMGDAWPTPYQPADRSLRRLDPAYAPGPPFDLVAGDVRSSLPFDDTAVVRSLSGEEIHLLFEQALALLPMGGRPFLQFSGLTVTYSASAPASSRILGVQLDDGTIIQKDQTLYTAVLSDFLTDGFGMFAFLADGTGMRQEPIADVVIEALGQQPGPIQAPPVGRLIAMP